MMIGNPIVFSLGLLQHGLIQRELAMASSRTLPTDRHLFRSRIRSSIFLQTLRPVTHPVNSHFRSSCQCASQCPELEVRRSRARSLCVPSGSWHHNVEIDWCTSAMLGDPVTHLMLQKGLPALHLYTLLRGTVQQSISVCACLCTNAMLGDLSVASNE